MMGSFLHGQVGLGRRQMRLAQHKLPQVSKLPARIGQQVAGRFGFPRAGMLRAQEL
jgi:hypothetical protein